MERFSIEDFGERIDSLYRLVIVASRRAAVLSKPDSRPFVTAHSKKPTIVALEEVLDGKVTYNTSGSDDEDYVE